MRIGLFTDTYHPVRNGVVVALDATRRELERLGHEVYIFAPDGGIVTGKQPDDPNVIRLPALQYDLQLSVFFPPAVLAKIKSLKLDVIHFFTPAMMGILAVQAARRTGAILVGKHSTDTYEFSKKYKAMALGIVLTGLASPLFLPMNSDRLRTFAKLYLTRRDQEPDERWYQRITAGLMGLLYSNCDGVVAVSEKSAAQLARFAERNGETLNLRVLPDGVDALPAASQSSLAEFQSKFGLVDGDEVVLNFGRMAEEKNLGLLIGMMPHLLKSRPRAKLMLAGDYVYRAQLEKMAAKSSVADKIIFTGRYDRSELPVICAAASVFAFPSLTDTQALVLNEAAGQGLPIVMCDHDLNDVFREGKNGLVAANDPQDFAAMVTEILSDTAMQQRFARASRRQAAEFSEAAQTEKLVDFYRELLHATNVI